jgi:Family of unknown function (DUF5898)
MSGTEDGDGRSIQSNKRYKRVDDDPMARQNASLAELKDALAASEKARKAMEAKYLAREAESEKARKAMEAKYLAREAESEKARKAMEAKYLAREAESEKARKAMEAEFKNDTAGVEPTTLRTLLALEKSSIALTLTGTNYSHVNGRKHDEAEAREGSFKFCRNLDLAKVPKFFGSQFLLGNGAQKGSIAFGTEDDVTRLVTNLIYDATNILNLLLGGFCVHVAQERSLFSGRADIVVARSETYGLPLLVIEVKKPVSKGSSLCDHARVLGQVYDYAEFLEAIGSPLPFVVLTSFEESMICWNGMANGNKGAGQFNEEILIVPPPVDTTPRKMNEANESPPASDSPPLLQSLPSTPTEGDNCVSPICFQKSQSDRTLLRSQVYGPHDLVYLFCNVLFRAAAAAKPGQHEKTIHDLKRGQTYHFPKVLCLTSNDAVKKNKYAWGSLTVCLSLTRQSILSQKSDGRQQQPRSQMDYYVIGKLGSGATSNVWHALDSKGNEVAIKMYVKTTDDKNNVLTADALEQQAKDAVGREVERLQSFYPFLKDKVHNVILNGFHCVVMPFFKPVPKSMRSSVLGNVAVVYRDQFKVPEKKERYMYTDGDVRWRHIGTYDVEEDDDNDRPPSQNTNVAIIARGMKTHYILFDLADLILLDSAMTKTECDELYKGHNTALELRMGDETVPTQAAFACNTVAPAEDDSRVEIVSKSQKSE